MFTNNKNKSKTIKLINQLSKQFGIDIQTIWYFIFSDLEKIDSEYFDEVDFIGLKSEITKLNNRYKTEKQNIEKEINLLKNELENELINYKKEKEKEISLTKKDILNQKTAINLNYENELNKLNYESAQIQKTIENQNKNLENIQNQIIKYKQESRLILEEIEIKTNELNELKLKIKNLSSNNNFIKKEIKKVDYDLMMKNHDIKETTDKGNKFLKVFLFFITLIAIVIAVILIINKK